MDRHRFDHAVRALQGGAPRRQVLGVLLGGALGIAGLVESEAKKKKKVTLCLNGQTMTVKKSKQASLLSQGATKGACPSQPSCPTGQKLCNARCIDNARCCTDADCDKCKQQTCQSNTCACKPGTVADATGFCGTPPPAGTNCVPVGGPFVNSAGQCCSQNAILANPITQDFACIPGGSTCVSPPDCGGGACRGFLCPAPYAATVGEACLSQ